MIVPILVNKILHHLSLGFLHLHSQKHLFLNRFQPFQNFYVLQEIPFFVFFGFFFQSFCEHGIGQFKRELIIKRFSGNHQRIKNIFVSKTVWLETTKAGCGLNFPLGSSKFNSTMSRCWIFTLDTLRTPYSFSLVLRLAFWFRQKSATSSTKRSGLSSGGTWPQSFKTTRREFKIES